MRRALILLVAVGALAACGSSTAAPSPPATTAAARCGPSSARTLASGPGARVYEQGNSVYGCAPGAAHSFRLGASGTSCIRTSLVGPVSVGGRDVAFGVQSCGVDTGSGSVVVRSLASGRTLYSHDAASYNRPESYTQVGSIAVTGAGAVAWIAHAASIVGHSSLTAVYRRAGSGAKQLDSGAAIGLRSLRRSGAQVSWQHGSARRTASLG